MEPSGISIDSSPTVSSSSNPRPAAHIHLLPHPFTHSMPPPLLITQGAESLLYKTHFLTPATAAALKIRPSKAWRHPTLDARLTKQRILAEARVLVKLAAISLGGDGMGVGFRVPAVFSVEWDMARRVKTLDASQRAEQTDVPSGGSGAWILMEWIDGFSVKDVLRDCDSRFKAGTLKEEEVKRMEIDVRRLLKRIGRAIGIMHARGGVVHGDLTTSNIMVRPLKSKGDTNGANVEETAEGCDSPSLNLLSEGYEIVLIDFGLATQSVQDEDRSVDLYVLERAFGSTHPRQEGWFDEEVLQAEEGYKGAWKGSKVVLKRLEDVRLRGRKRSMLG